MTSNVCDSKEPEMRPSTLSDDYGALFLLLMYKWISTCVLGLMDNYEGEPWKNPYGLIKGHPWGMHFNERIRAFVRSF